MLFGFAAAITRSRRSLVLFGGCAILMFIIGWCLAGALLAMNILMSDACKHDMPFSFLGISQVSSQNYFGNKSIKESNETMANNVDSIGNVKFCIVIICFCRL
uniref:Uncharacterized protein n=1 Tax=Romanomermis culicivorax TaxID=13658 RepID=A0A915HIK6_ROMCU